MRLATTLFLAHGPKDHGIVRCNWHAAAVVFQFFAHLVNGNHLWLMTHMRSVQPRGGRSHENRKSCLTHPLMPNLKKWGLQALGAL